MGPPVPKNGLTKYLGTGEWSAGWRSTTDPVAEFLTLSWIIRYGACLGLIHLVPKFRVANF